MVTGMTFFTRAAIKISQSLLLLEFSCQNALIIVVKCSELRLKEKKIKRSFIFCIFPLPQIPSFLWNDSYTPVNPVLLYERININKRFERQSTYRLHGHKMEVVDSGKYLGVHLTNYLTWHKHVDATVAKASKTLGFLIRNLSECTTHVKSAAYTSLVRPTLEYSSAVWDPSSTEDINQLEKVQSRSLCSQQILRQDTGMRLKNGLRSWLGASTEEKTVRQADNSIQDSAGIGGNGHW